MGGRRGEGEGGKGGPRLLRTGMLAEHDNNIIPKLFLVYCPFLHLPSVVRLHLSRRLTDRTPQSRKN